MPGAGAQALLGFRFSRELLFPVIFLYLDLPGVLAELLLLNNPGLRDPGSFTQLILDFERLLGPGNNIDRSSQRRNRGQVCFLLTFGMIGTGTQSLLRSLGEFLFPLVFLYFDPPGIFVDLLLLDDPEFRDPGSFTPFIPNPERLLGLDGYLNRDSHRRIRPPLSGIATGPLVEIATGPLAGFPLPRGFT